MDIYKFKRNFERSLYAAWIGGSVCALYGTSIADWRLWAVTLPTVLFVTLFNQTDFELD